MRRMWRSLGLMMAVLVTPALAVPPAAPATASASTAAAGTATLVTGHVSAASPSGEIRDIVKGGPVYQGEVIITASSSYVNIAFSDGGRVLLRPESRFSIERYQYAGHRHPGRRADQPARQESAFFRLLKGGFRAVSGLIGHTRREDYAVQTPVATIGIRGTDYEVRLLQRGLRGHQPDAEGRAVCGRAVRVHRPDQPGRHHHPHGRPVRVHRRQQRGPGALRHPPPGSDPAT